MQHRLPTQKAEDEILFPVFEQIEQAQIWIPEDEIYHYYQGRHNKLLKRLKKEFPEEFPETGQNYSAEL